MLLHSISTEFLPHALKLQEEQHISQFLMNLPPEFEPVHAALMNREISTDLDTCVQEIMREKSSIGLQQVLTEEPKAFLTAPAPLTTDETALLTTRGQKPQCF